MQLRQLAYFAAVVENGSFSSAAAALYIAQSSLSQSVQNLERELGFPLLTRAYSGVTPTRMGRLVYDDAKRLLSQVDELTRSWRETYAGRAALHGTVRIAAVPGVQPILRRQMLPALSESYPNISCRISEARNAVLQEYLSSGQADVILCDYPDARLEEMRSLACEKGLELLS